jgi:hypothetical protein
MANEPFRFLDLPAELRCMVYEFLETETRLHTIDDVYLVGCMIASKSTSQLTIVVKDIPTSILTTCRSVYAEAAPIITPKLQRLRRTEPIHFIVDSCSFNSLFKASTGLRLAFVNKEQGIPRRLHYYDSGYGRILDFISKCGVYMRTMKSGKMTVTVKSRSDAILLCYIMNDIYDSEFWREHFGIIEAEIQFYDFNHQGMATIGNWITLFNQQGTDPAIHRVVEEKEWGELWAHEQVWGL